MACDMTSEYSVYHRIASALTVSDFATPIEYSFEFDTPIKSVADQIGEGRSRVVLIKKEGAVIGFAVTSGYFEPDEADRPIGYKLQRIKPENIIPARTSLLEIVPLWESGYHFFVQNEETITHIVARHDMDSPVVKTALFALTAELEQRMLLHIMADLEQIKPRFERLTADQQRNVKRLFKKELYKDILKGNEDRDMSIVHVQNTYFSHKIIIFLETPELLSLLPFETKEDAQKDLNFIKDLRNELAHGGSIFNIIRDARELKNIIDVTEEIIGCLR